MQLFSQGNAPGVGKVRRGDVREKRDQGADHKGCSFFRVNPPSYTLFACLTAGQGKVLSAIGPAISGCIFSTIRTPCNNPFFSFLQITFEKSKLAQRIATRCKGHSGELRTAIPQNSTLSNILVSDRYKTLFCFVPKVACGNWKRIFLVLNGQFNSTTEISGFTAHESGLVDTLDKYSTNEIRLKLQTYKKIVFVREPLERVLSAYRNKFTTVLHRRIFNQRVGKKIITMYRKNLTKEVTDEDHVTFNEFVKYLIGLSPMEKPDIHWDQQYNICSPCDINYDFIGKYETLKSDVERALGIMGAIEKVTFPGYW